MTDPSPRPSAARTDFDASLAYLVTALANKLTIYTSRWFQRRLGISLMQWRTIALLAVEGTASPARICEVAGVDKSVVSRAVTGLERRGLVRITPDGGRGRQTRLELTPAGLTLHDRGIADVLANEVRLEDGLTPADQAAMAAHLKRMTANLLRFPEP